MIVLESMIQGSEQWLNARKGRATASEFKKILTATGKPSKSSLSYMRKLARECVCDDPQEFIGNKFTDWGHEWEPVARQWFADNVNPLVKEVGFVGRGDGAPVGCSPDSLIVNAAGDYIEGLEIKCPQVDTHVKYLMEGVLPDDYKLQVHGSMAVTGLDRWHFVSFFPELPALHLVIERDAFTEKVGAALDQFIIEYAPERERVLTMLGIVTEAEADQDEGGVI
tara:strand:- start:3798 stop:4469 length:672 start_codon:yes stop_codon:yes gene_type:complete